MKTAIVVGAGLAGAVAAALLRDKYRVTVLERDSKIGGLCQDTGGVQWRGAKTFHTCDDEVMRFLSGFGEFQTHTHRVHVFSDSHGLRPFEGVTEDTAAYCEKAWGVRQADLPSEITGRVSASSAQAYHAASKISCQPVRGYSALIGKMLDHENIDVVVGERAMSVQRRADACVWAGDINDLYPELPKLPWRGRRWEYIPFASLPSGVSVINYASFSVPQLRSIDCRTVNPYFCAEGVVNEYADSMEGAYGCYPSFHQEDKKEAARRVSAAAAQGIICVGRLGTYRYLDMSDVVRDVIDKLKAIE